MSVAVEAFELVPIVAPYYSFEQIPCCGNTQGGPKRNGLNQVLDLDDQPIPRLFAAGEMGTVYAYKYNLGGNFGGGMADGRVCAREIGKMARWDE